MGMDTPIKIWRELVANEKLFHDPAQERAAQMLTLLQSRLQDWQPQKKPILFGRTIPQPKGLYLYGEVGRGKSMLMDMFYASAPVERKTRVHFHDFMQSVHQKIATWRKLDDKEKKRHQDYVRGSLSDPVIAVAKSIADKSHLICFDEFQVSDIADAMLLGRLFEQLFARNVVMVATSNRAPSDLYKDGLNRQRFVPFIKLLERQVDVLDLQAAKDYRRDRLQTQKLYFTPLGQSAEIQIEEVWQQLIVGATASSRTLLVQGRELPIKQTFGGAARLTFAELCQTTRGVADYLMLAEQFHTLFLEDVPQMQTEQRNEAKRFVLLIDALYEARVKLIISADAEPEKLYQDGDGSFEFARCASRLNEMRSDNWVELHHDGKGLAV